jgi:hypothetical protein
VIVLFGNFTDSISPVSTGGSGEPFKEEKAASVYMQKAWAAFIKDPANGLKGLGWKPYEGEQSETLVDLFRDSDLQNPIHFENPTEFDSGCAAIGLGL